MCSTCGCGDDKGARLTLMDSADAAHGSTSHHYLGEARIEHAHGTVDLEQRILAKNDALAAHNRATLHERGIVAINLMSSPGAGKTTLLEQTIRALADDVDVAVIEGDQETPLDAARIQATGVPVVQINTGAGCHLDAQMVHDALHALDPVPGSMLFVENVGNLVCPALFDLGESRRVVLTSVTEGADKPLKYPHMFRSADLVVLNKADLLPYVDFDESAFAANTRRISADLPILTVTATRRNGVGPWLDWLRAASETARSVALLDTVTRQI